MKLAGSLLAAVLVLAACVPRPVVAPPPPPPLPPPPPPPVETEAERAVRAQQLWTSGVALGRQGRWFEAERAYREAVELSPDSAGYRHSLATALLQQQRYSQAADVLLAAIQLEEAGPSPNHRVLAVDYERLIQILERVNRLDEARTARERQRLHRMLRDAQPPD